MNTVYVLQHEREHLSGRDDVRLIGVYSSRARARAAIRRLRSAPGFRDCRRGFYIDAYRVDEDHWVEGFVDGTP
jgi:hypothetical protein